MQELTSEGSHKRGSLSIIVPVFNPGQSLKRLLASLPDDERLDIIFVDDGSTDGSRERLENFVVNRRAVLVASSGRGPGTARNTGMTHAKGDFVSFADADDECRLSILFAAVDDCVKFGADVAICGYLRTNGQDFSKVVLPLGVELDSLWVESHSVLKERAAVWGKVYRKNFLLESRVFFPEELGAEDVVFSYRLALANPRTRVIPEIGYTYYYADVQGQLTSTNTYFRNGFSTISSIINAEPNSRDEKFLLSYVSLSSTPYLFRGEGPVYGTFRVGKFLCRSLCVLGFRAMGTAVIEIVKRRYLGRRAR